MAVDSAETAKRRAAQATYAERIRGLNLTPYLFLVVPLALFLVWVIGPMFYSFYLSFTSWDGISTPRFIGLDNYIRLFNDPVFHTTVLNNVKWLVSFITVPVVMGLALAMALNRDMPGVRFIKSSFYFPYILALVVVGLIWGWMYHPASGLLNSTLRALGLGQFTQGWLSNPTLVTWCIIAAAVWRQVGYIMTLYLAGLQGVDPALVEAAEVDGASKWQSFRHVILPLLNPVTVVVLVISVIDSLRSFDLVYIMTRGGPATLPTSWPTSCISRHLTTTTWATAQPSPSCSFSSTQYSSSSTSRERCARNWNTKRRPE